MTVEGYPLQKRPGSGAKQKPIKHGTYGGYRAELRRGQATCPACRAAWNTYCGQQREIKKGVAAKLRQKEIDAIVQTVKEELGYA